MCQPILALVLEHDPISLISSRHFKIRDTENNLTKRQRTDIMQTALKIKLLNALKLFKT
jgi:hypothetical protein